MKVDQISVFLENKPGGLEDTTRILAEAGINIRALSLADTSDFGILRLIVDDTDAAEEALQAQGLRIRKTPVVAVEVPDRPGGFHGIMEALSEKGVNVEYTYAFVERSGENAIIIFRFDKIDEAIEALQKKGITILPGEKVHSL